jgi:hypothetical protein
MVLLTMRALLAQLRDLLAPLRASVPRRRASLGLGLGVVAWCAGAAHAEEVAITAVHVARTDTLVVCHLDTRGLPDPPSRDTLASGLPSALVLALTLEDDRGDRVGTRRVEVRLEPDLWEGTLVVKTPLADHRLASVDELPAFLATLGPLPVAPVSALSPSRRWRLRVQLAVHPLAPTEVARVRQIFTEERAPVSSRQEVSVGLRSLVNVFFGDPPDEEWVDDARSPLFETATLVRWPDQGVP